MTTGRPRTARPRPAPLRIIEGPVRLAALACLVVLPLLSFLPAEIVERTSAGKDFEHFIAYAGTGLLLTLGIGPRWARIVAVALLIGFAGALEIAQMFTATRSAEWAQFIAGSFGAVTGLLAGSLGRLVLARLFPIVP